MLGPIGVAVSLSRAALAAKQHWDLLSADERRRLGVLVRASRGRPAALSHAERRELAELVGRLELLRLGRTLAMTASPLPHRRRR